MRRLSAGSAALGLLAILLMELSRPACALGPGLPPLEVTDLYEQPANLSSCAAGEQALFLTSFSKTASQHCQPLEAQLWAAYHQKPPCRVFTVLELQTVPGILMPIIRSVVRSRTPKQYWNRVFLDRKGLKALRNSLSYTAASPDDIYAALLDGQGRATWIAHGIEGPAFLAGIKTALDKPVP